MYDVDYYFEEILIGLTLPAMQKLGKKHSSVWSWNLISKKRKAWCGSEIPGNDVIFYSPTIFSGSLQI